MAAGLLSVVISATAALMSPQPATATINRMVSFQGKVTNSNGTNVTNGSYNFTFRIYNHPSNNPSGACSGACLWQEASKSLTVTDGVFQTNLGDATSLPGSIDFNSDTIYLGITFNGDNEMSPRIRFTAAAYAFNSDALDGLDSAAFAQLAANQTFTGANLFAPTTGIVALTVKASTAGGQNSLEVFDSSNTRQAYFDATGNLNVARTIQPTSTNAIDLGLTGTTFRTGYFGTSVVSPSFTGSGAVTLSSGSSSALTLDSASQTLVIAASDTTLSRTAVGTYTIDLVDGSATTLAVTNSGAGAASVSIDSAVIVPTVQTADGAGASASLSVRSGTTTGGSGLSTGTVTIKSGDGSGTNTSSGNVTIDTGTKSGSGFSGNLYIGDTNAPNVNIGRSGATAPTLTIQGLAGTGGAGSSLTFSGGGFVTTIKAATPGGDRSITIPDADGTLCTTTASTCSATYQTAGSYLLQNPASNQTSTSSFTGYQYTFTQNASGAAGNLQLNNAGTNSALAVTQSGNPSAGQAVILATNSNGTPTGNLLDLRVTAGSRFAVDVAGAVTTGSSINGQTISSTANFTGTVTSASTISVTAGGISVTGNSTIAGTLGGITGLTVASGGASISGGLNNNDGGLTATGSIAGATTISLNSTISGGTTYSASAALEAPLVNSANTSAGSTNSAAITLRSGNATGATSNSGNVTVDAGTATQTAGTVNLGTSNASAINVGHSAAPVTVQGTAASSLIFGNTTINAVTSGTAATYSFAAPTSATTYTICTTDLNSCGNSSTGYLRKGVAGETSTASLGNAQALYTFGNSGSTVDSNVLVLDSGVGTGSTLRVLAASNPSASNALIYARLTNASVGGNLIDLWSGASGSETSKFSVTAAGAVTTASTINGQTINTTSSLATVNTSGLLTANAGLTVNSTVATFTAGATVSAGLFTAAAAASITGGIDNNAGGITEAGAISGLSSLEFNTAGTIDANGAVAINIGTTNANVLNIGRVGATLSLQGNTSTSLVASNGTNTITARFQNPSANVIYEFANGTGGTYQICSTLASTCGTTYAAYYAAGYVQLAPGSAQGDANSNASIFINKTSGTTLMNMQASGSTVFQLQTSGTLYTGGNSSSYAMQVDTTNFKVRIGTGTPTLGSGGANATAALYVSGAAEFAGQIRVGDGTNSAAFDGTTKEVTFNGTARHSRRVTLAPEYEGATMTGDGASNSGLMTSDFCSGTSRRSIQTSFCASTDEHNYYKWTSANGSTQDYDIWIRYRMPTDFAAFAASDAINMFGWRTGSSDSVTLSFYQANGTLCGTATNVATGTAAWTETTMTGTISSCSFAADDLVTFRIQMASSATSNYAMAGEIRFNYLSKW